MIWIWMSRMAKLVMMQAGPTTRASTQMEQSRRRKSLNGFIAQIIRHAILVSHGAST